MKTYIDFKYTTSGLGPVTNHAISYNNRNAEIKDLETFSKDTLAQCFPVNFAKVLRTPFLQNTSGRLLLAATG